VGVQEAGVRGGGGGINDCFCNGTFEKLSGQLTASSLHACRVLAVPVKPSLMTCRHCAGSTSRNTLRYAEKIANNWLGFPIMNIL
jgi:hypothetical protein